MNTEIDDRMMSKILDLNADRFKKALYKGIGSGKIFGCGLMLVRRI